MLTPTAVTTPSDVPSWANVSAGWGHTCSLSSTGKMFCFGDLGGVGRLTVAVLAVKHRALASIELKRKRNNALMLLWMQDTMNWANLEYQESRPMCEFQQLSRLLQE